MPRLVEPLCKATEDLFRPVALASNDRIHIEIGGDNRNQFLVHAYAIRPDGTKTAASEAASLKWFLRLPEREELNYGRWLIAATDVNALVTATLWDRERITFSDEAQVLFDYLILRFCQQTDVARVKAAFKEQAMVPERPTGWRDCAERPLADYQFVGATTTCQLEGSGLFMEQGTGKTPTLICSAMNEAAALFAAEGRPARFITVCPKNVRQNWHNEIVRFATLPGRVTVLRGGAINRVKQLVDVARADDGSQFVWVICSYEGLIRTWNALGMFEWDRATLDESHNIKSPWAKRSPFMMNLRDRSARRSVLTGTPMANGVLDLYYQLEFLGDGQSGFSSWKAFRKYYEQYAENEEDGNFTGRDRKLVGYKNLPILQERLARLAFFMTKKEAMPSLPDKVYDILEADMSPQQREYYLKVSKELALEIESDLAGIDGDSARASMTIQNVLTKLLRLSQVTSGFVVSDKAFDDEGNPIRDNYDDRVHFFDSVPKMDALIETIKEKGPLEKTVVWSCWIPCVREIGRRLTEAGIGHVTFTGSTTDAEREEACRKFNQDPSCKVFVGNPAAGGVGMNLPGYVPDWEGTDKDPGTNADHTIYFAMNWSMIQRSQSEDRNHGKGRNRVQVRVSDYCVPGTIDDEIRERVLSKKAFALAVQDVRALMKRLLDVGSMLQGGDDE